MTAQRIEAAKPTKPKGSAEGESLVANGDAPNLLAQKDIPMTDTTDQQAVTVARVYRDAAEEWRFIECRLCSEYEGDFVSDLAADFARLASVSSASAEIPAGMKPWTGGDACPADWHWPREVMLRNGAVIHGMRADDLRWCWATGDGASQDVVAYRAMLAASPEPVPATNQAGEVVQRVKDLLRGPDGEEHTDSGMEDAFFRWPVVSRAILSALATQPAKDKTDDVVFRNGERAVVLGDGLGMGRDDAGQHRSLAAAEAIRSAFFTSVSGEKPHRYHLSLGYPTMEAMHKAEDAIKAWAKSVLEPVSATQPATSQEGEGTGWVAWNPDSGEEYTPNHPVESGECVEAERIRRSTPQEDTLWQGMQEQFMRAEALTVALAATPTPPTLSEDLREARVYIAARFSRRHECNALGHILKSHGCTITSRWVKPDCEHVLPTGISERAADHERQRFALEDVDDVRAANWTISFMEEPRGNSRGGRHIEFGMAVALGHRLTIIGPRETVFHHLPNVEQFDTVADFTAALARAQVKPS